MNIHCGNAKSNWVCALLRLTWNSDMSWRAGAEVQPSISAMDRQKQWYVSIRSWPGQPEVHSNSLFRNEQTNLSQFSSIEFIVTTQSLCCTVDSTTYRFEVLITTLSCENHKNERWGWGRRWVSNTSLCVCVCVPLGANKPTLPRL